jgi:hypothetical protein
VSAPPLRLVSSLPPPHDPGERTPVAWVGLWEVRQFPDGDARLAYFRPRGFHHLQLWNPAARISILTPSRLTAGLFEMWPEGGQRSSAATWRQVTEQLRGVELPSAIEISALESWFIEREEPRALRLLRAWWRRAPSTRPAAS